MLCIFINLSIINLTFSYTSNICGEIRVFFSFFYIGFASQWSIYFLSSARIFSINCEQSINKPHNIKAGCTLSNEMLQHQDMALKDVGLIGLLQVTGTIKCQIFPLTDTFLVRIKFCENFQPCRSFIILFASNT